MDQRRSKNVSGCVDTGSMSAVDEAVSAAVAEWQHDHHIVYDTSPLAEMVASLMNDMLGANRDAALVEAVTIARDVRRREIELHQCSFDEMPEANRLFVYGADRAAEHIDAARVGRR